MTSPSPHHARTFALLGVAALLAAAPANAIEIPKELRKKLLESSASKDGGSMEALSGEPVDNSIDPKTYMVGGGDGFQISIVGMPSQGYAPVIGSDGNIYEGELGVIKLGRIPLERATEIIAKHVRAIIKRDYPVRVGLVRVKSAVVTVSGAVSNPGTYAVPGTRRLIDVLRLANENVLPSIANHDFRQVTVSGPDSVRTYDLLRFIAHTDLAQNPYVYPGDNVSLRPADSRVFVGGEALGPVSGWTPVKPGETLADLLGLLRSRRTGDSTRVLLQQASSSTQAGTSEIPVAEAGKVILEDGDMVSFPKAGTRRNLDTALVAGEILRPGTYPIIPGMTTAEEIIRLSGGATEDGDLSRAYLVRARKLLGASKPLLDDLDPAGALVRRQARTFAQAVRPEAGAAMADMKESGDFAVIELGKDASSVRIEEGDRLYVPRKETLVYVSGNVAKPGAYPYVKGDDFGDYVDKAGGYTNRAGPKHNYVVGIYEGVTQIKDTDRIAQGDVLVVPSSVEYKTYSAVYLPILQIVPAVLSLAVSILILSNQ